MMKFLEKIRSIDELNIIIKNCKEKNQKIVLCHGTFDLLHPGHLRYFQEAKKLGDKLIVTITSDEFVNKGPNRPIYNENLRAEFIASLQYVDFVGINENADAVQLINKLKPSLYVKGEDYKDHSTDITGKISLEVEAVKENGGDIHYTSGIRFSSTNLINTFGKELL